MMLTRNFGELLPRRLTSDRAFREALLFVGIVGRLQKQASSTSMLQKGLRYLRHTYFPNIYPQDFLFQVV
jgi:hypothetical protein